MNRLVQWLIINLFGFLVRGRPPRPRPALVRGILLISTTGLGDTVISTAGMVLARAVWPEARITALLHRRWAGLLAGSRFLDEIVVYPGKFKGLCGLIRRLRSLDLDLALVLHGNDPDIVPLAWLSGARYLVAQDTTKLAFLLDQAVPNPDPRRHIAARRLDLIRAVSDPRPGLLEIGSPRVEIPGTLATWAGEYWDAHGVTSGESLIILNPGGSRQPKRWPEEHWRALIDLLIRRAGWRVALVGGPAEMEIMTRLARGAMDRVLVATRPDLLETAALLARARAFVGPDSGLAHLAVAVEVPAVVFFGPDNAELSRPYRPRRPAVFLQSPTEVCPNVAACHKTECRPNRCLLAITPDQIRAALDQVLAGE